MDANGHNLGGGRTAVITGGTAGIGRATANLLARQGFSLALIARGEEGLGKAKRELSPLTRVEIYQCDVADDARVQETADAIARDLGGIDVWVNNAMLTIVAPFERVKAEDFDQVFDATFKGYVHGMRAALRHMPMRGQIVNVSSALAYRSVPLQSAYCAAKAAVNGLTASVRSEMIHEGRDVALSIITLPGLDTPQFDWSKNQMPQKQRPAPPVFDPSTAAQGVLKAIRERSREVIVSRVALGLTMAQMAIPDALDHKLAKDGYDGQQEDGVPAGSVLAENNIYEPIDEERYYGARGSFGDESESTAMAVDGDVARYSIFGAGALLATGLGILIGAAAGRSRAHREIEVDQRDYGHRERVARANGLRDRADELRYDQPVLGDPGMVGTRSETRTDIAVQGASERA